MDQRHAVIGQKIAHLVEKGRVIRHTHMLEHADRDDTVELAAELPVIDELELAARIETCVPAARSLRNGDLFLAERDA